MGPLLLDVPQMIDLALGTPEVGVVNFNVLHSLLHVMAKQMNLEKCRIEFRGSHGSKIENLAKNLGAQSDLSIIEYKVEEKRNSMGHVVKQLSPQDSKQSSEIEKILLVGKSDELLENPESAVDLSVVSVNDQQDVCDSARASDFTPTNEPAEVTSLKKRVEDNEIRLEKLTSLIRDLSEKIRRTEKIARRPSDTEEISSLADKVDSLGKLLHDQTSSMQIVLPPKTDDTQITHPPLNRTTSTSSGESKELQAIKQEVENLKGIVLLIRSKLSDASSSTELNILRPVTPVSTSTNSQVDPSFVESRMSKYDSKIEVIERIISEIQMNLSEQLVAKSQSFVRASYQSDPSGIADVYTELGDIRSDLDKNVEQYSQLSTENVQFLKNIENLNQQIEGLQKSKVDKQEVEELLCEKADYNMLQRKVSIDHFDATKRDIFTNIDDVLSKVQGQTQIIDSLMQEVRTSIESKAEKTEIAQLTDRLDKRLQGMQERLIALAAMNRDPEAAGSKVKFLRDVACLSCNQNVQMRISEKTLIPRPESTLEQRSLKPFLTYELDVLRQRKKDMSNFKDANVIEMLMKHGVPSANPNRQLAARYCGGSHTVITPQSRVQRSKFNKSATSRNVTLRCVEKDSTAKQHGTSESPKRRNSARI